MFSPTATTRRQFITALLLATFVGTAINAIPFAAQAYDENSEIAINLDGQGVALKGYDPLSYFLQGGPILGKAEYSHTYDGATYRFATAAHRDAFTADPARYAPAFGGFCAMGVAMNKKLDVNPLLWRIVDGKLYLNVHEDAQIRWLQDVKGNITQALSNWSAIKDKAPRAL